jgi:hypothetical protein
MRYGPGRSIDKSHKTSIESDVNCGTIGELGRIWLLPQDRLQALDLKPANV